MKMQSSAYSVTQEIIIMDTRVLYLSCRIS